MELAVKSFEVFQRRRSLLADLPEQYNQLKELSSASKNDWHKYWKSNPINAWIGGNSSDAKAFFVVIDGEFCFQSKIDEQFYNSFVVLVQEVVSYRFLQYESRLANKGRTEMPIAYLEDQQQISYFSDLKIACGHFKFSQHESENIEHQSLPLSYGKLNPARHFIARASGSSMDGGRNPIKHGDYLLFELITPENAGSNDGKTIAIERQDITGDDQYLLRTVKKLGNNQYQLNAKNSDYEPIMATAEMNTFARLRQVIDVADILLHKEFYKYEVADLFGLEYKEGLWKMPGHVCPKESDDQFLFVTLSKQNAGIDYRYHDYFVDNSHFHWQSQNRTTPNHDKGIGIIESNSLSGSIYLFVRKFPKIKGKGAPFMFCGKLSYEKHSGSGPIDVNFELESPLPPSLYEYYGT
jgi:SOS-response transcriptional repressor LexA